MMSEHSNALCASISPDFCNPEDFIYNASQLLILVVWTVRCDKNRFFFASWTRFCCIVKYGIAHSCVKRKRQWIAGFRLYQADAVMFPVYIPMI